LKLIIGKINRGLLSDLKEQRKPITAGLICVVVASAISAVPILITKYGLHAIEVKPPDLHLLAFMCAATVGVYAAKYWFTRGQSLYLAQASALLGVSLRTRIFAKLLRLPISYFNRVRSGAIQSVLDNDVGLYQNSVNLMKDSIEGPIKAVAALVTVLILQWQLFLLALVTVFLTELIVRRSTREVKRAQSQVQRDLSEYSSLTQEALAGTRVIKALSAEEQLKERHHSMLRQIYESWMGTIRTISSLKPQIELVGACALAAALYFCGYLARHGNLHVSDIGALIVALDTINSGVRAISNVRSSHAQILSAAERIYEEVLDIPLEEQIEKGVVLSELKGDLEFKNVSFVYPDGTRALSHLNLKIPAGKSLALVGPSGAGKSTIVDLLLKFYDPTEGEILLDGVSITQLDTEWLRANIGLVPQHTFLFAGTIAENLRIGNPEANEEELRSAARMAHAQGFVEALPLGYETAIGERGVGLSGGEMQRLAIARALLRSPKLLILDEATSNLDAHSEQAVQEALQEAMQHRTTLSIAHRLTTAARADRIAVLSKGEVIEQGTHEGLMRSNGVYSAMYAAFSSGLLDTQPEDSPATLEPAQ
jgi:subfamily B ATP-binding cassette protein MsbA